MACGGFIMVKYRDSLSDIQNIIQLIRCNEKTAKQLSNELQIPICTTYRLLKQLIKVNWIKENGLKHNKHGRGSMSYLSLVKIEYFRTNGG